MSVKVLKFGGSSVADADQIRKIKAIVEADPERRYVVVSAPGKRYSGDSKVTDLLFMLWAQIEHNIPYDALFDTIMSRYTSIEDELGVDAGIRGRFDEIRNKIEKGCTESYIVSRGEYLSAVLISGVLGYDFVDSEGRVLFDARGRLLAEETDAALRQELAQHERAVVPGFYGSSVADGRICLLSRGGSDVTGSLVARAADASIYENWTDVSGMLMADPRVVDDPRPIRHISYMELRELSYMGASVLHEDAVFPARMSDIPINIRNTNVPDAPGTIISKGGDDNSPEIISGIAGKKGFTVISIYKNMMNKEIGFVRRALAIIEDQHVNFDHIPTGIDSLSMVIESSELEDKLDDILAEFRHQLKPDDITVEDNIALIATVGLRMHRTLGVAARICTALADSGVNIRMLNQGTNEINVIVGVESQDFEKATRVIYNEFIK
ncbi:MAG: aspartate kinase [Mogibacterium sp.]|nr:aspartate kinase [Mogibacterium sp.]